jgi:hypothetical protein
MSQRIQEAQSGSARRTVASYARAEKFMLALLNGKNMGDACQEANISRRTGSRLGVSAEFKVRFKKARSEMLEQAINKLHADAGACVAVLREIALNPQSKGHDRVQASYRLLDLLLRAQETVVFEARLAVLEESVEGGK